MFIDAYDWIMVPNVYGMSQFADGGLIMTRLYLSSRHYLLKMSDYPAGPWCEIWDGLCWRFIEKHQDYFQQNPRWKPLVRHWNRMSQERFRELIISGRKFLGWVAPWIVINLFFQTNKIDQGFPESRPGRLTSG